MLTHADPGASRRSPRTGLRLAIAGLAVLLLSGCSNAIQRVWEPASSVGATNQTDRITQLWVGSWIAAMSVGVLVWGLVIWCVVAYRRRKDDIGYPAQIKYNVPIEIMYTVIPLMMIAVLFYYTARDQAAIADTKQKPDITIGVVAKRWSWDFNYLTQNGAPLAVYESGVQGQLNGTDAPEKELPTLWLPVNQRVQFTLTARDVIHSFWVPAFLYKMDAIPGIENSFQVVPTKIGEFRGKCAELCGEYHSEMLFNVKVVSQADFDAHIADLRAKGQTGALGNDLNLEKFPSGGATPGHALEPAGTATATAEGTAP